MNKLVLGITGSKTYENRAKIKMFIHKLKEQTDQDIQIVGLGDKVGADRYVKKFALELGYEYKEMNPPHTPKNLYSLMSEAYYDKPYNNKSYHMRGKIYCQYIEKCVVFDDSNTTDKKVNNLIKELTKARKRAIIITP